MTESVENRQHASSKPRRHRFAISLRALMLIVLVVGGLLGWRARRASIQRRAVAVIKEAGGMVQYDHQLVAGKLASPTPDPPFPAWFRRAIGDEYFQEPATVYILGSPRSGGEGPADAGLAAVAALDHVWRLQTVRVPVSNAGIASLAAMPRLEHLSLADVDVTDDGLESLGSFPALEELCLRVRPGRITARGVGFIGRQARLKSLVLVNARLDEPSSLSPLARLTRLEDLEITRSPRDDACLDHLAGLDRMTTLCLRQTRLTDAGVDRLKAMTRLGCLEFDASLLTEGGLLRLWGDHPKLTEVCLAPAPKLTSASLAIASMLPNLTELHLPGSNMTDAGLDRLRGLKLQGLRISGSGVTDAGVARLAASNQFTTLGLTGTGVNGSDLAWLTGQARLSTLRLDGTRVGDAAMAAVSSAPALETLTLAETSLTDSGLNALQQAARLTYLDVRSTKVTQAGLAAYRSVRPGVYVRAGPSEVDP